MRFREAVRRCRVTTSAVAVVLGTLAILPSKGAAAELVVQSASGRAGEVVEIAVLLNPQGRNVAAVVFEVEYDVTKLRFEGGSATAAEGDHLKGFATETVHIAGGRIGVAVYDPESPLVAIPAGVIATLRFLVLPDARDFAAVSIAGRPADAADLDGVAVPVTVSAVPSGVRIVSSRPRAVRSY